MAGRTNAGRQAGAGGATPRRPARVWPPGELRGRGRVRRPGGLLVLDGQVLVGVGGQVPDGLRADGGPVLGWMPAGVVGPWVVSGRAGTVGRVGTVAVGAVVVCGAVAVIAVAVRVVGMVAVVAVGGAVAVGVVVFSVRSGSSSAAVGSASSSDWSSVGPPGRGRGLAVVRRPSVACRTGSRPACTRLPKSGSSIWRGHRTRRSQSAGRRGPSYRDGNGSARSVSLAFGVSSAVLRTVPLEIANLLSGEAENVPQQLVDFVDHRFHPGHVELVPDTAVVDLQ